MPIIRHEAKTFTMVPNVLLYDDALSLKARAILAYLLSKPDHWEFSMKQLYTISKKDGTASIRSGVKELQDAGYIRYEMVREHGRINKTLWYVHNQRQTIDIPTLSPCAEKPHTEKPHTEKPHTEKPHAENRTLVITDKKERLKESNTPPLSPKGEPAYSPAFVAFWSVYPKKVGKDAAWQVWRSHQLNSLAETIVASVHAHIAQDPQWREQRFTPNPATYLHQGRWKDELSESASSLVPSSLLENPRTAANVQSGMRGMQRLMAKYDRKDGSRGQA